MNESGLPELKKMTKFGEKNSMTVPNLSDFWANPSCSSPTKKCLRDGGVIDRSTVFKCGPNPVSFCLFSSFSRGSDKYSIKCYF